MWYAILLAGAIGLDQLLKWAGIIESGGQVKPLLEEKMILVNGNIETAKRRRLFPGDTVEIMEMGCWQVAREETGVQ